MEGFLNKNDKGQGGMGIFALSSSSPRAEKQGRGGTHRRRPWAGGLGLGSGSGVREKREGGGRVRSPVAARPEAARGGLATTAGGSGRRVALGQRSRGVVAVKWMEESTREPRGVGSPAHLG